MHIHVVPDMTMGLKEDDAIWKRKIAVHDSDKEFIYAGSTGLLCDTFRTTCITVAPESNGK